MAQAQPGQASGRPCGGLPECWEEGEGTSPFSFQATSWGQPGGCTRGGAPAKATPSADRTPDWTPSDE